MWHPTDTVRHPIPAGRWPTEAEAARARWFAPLDTARLHLHERTWVPAMVPWRATEDGLVTTDVLNWYGRFAQGQPGAIVVEATGVRDVPSGPLLRVGHDRFVPGLQQLVQRIKDGSGGRTRVFMQLIDFLSVKRRPERDTYFRRYLEITDGHRAALRDSSATDDDIREALVAMSDEALRDVLTPRELESLRFGYRERVTDMHLPHVRDLPALLPDIFAAAAARAEAAGFDGVELHYAHAYTMASFLSALNTRADGYGGTRFGRIRLPLEVFRAVRARVSDRFVVGCRFLSEEMIFGGSTLDDAAYFGVEFGKAGMDYLSLSRGGKFEDAKAPQVGCAVYPYTGPSGWECMPTVLADAQGPFGRGVPASAAVKDALRSAGLDTPVVVAGGIHAFDQAETILANGQADIVAAARQSLADPDWFLKIRLGRGADVRRCAFTNYCEGLDQKHKQVTCKLWDRMELDAPGVTRSSDGRRRLTAPAWSCVLQPVGDD
jgi:2,4-dienoyl-CoA reductase-like NADH-dependent reductase (Old Yellow Enzyme family)